MRLRAILLGAKVPLCGTAVAMTAAYGTATEVGEIPAETAASTSQQKTHNFPAKADLNGRAGKSLNARTVKVGQYLKGQSVPVICQDDGEVAYGSVIWDYTIDKTWVPDHYVETGSHGFANGVPRCGSSTTPGSMTFTTPTDLNGRADKQLSAPVRKVYRKGTPVTVTCQAYGDYAHGSYIWDRTREELWVADKYLRNGSDGFLATLPRCDDDPPTDGGNAIGTGGKGSSNCHSRRAHHGRNNGPGGSNRGTVKRRRARIVAAARSMMGHGYSYAWGGGGKGGPSCGIDQRSPAGMYDYWRYGFDCSGLSLYAVWKALGIDAGGNTRVQYGNPRGRKVRWSHRRPGDLLFWGRNGKPYHVAVYVGGGKVIEANTPRGSNSVHEKRVYESPHWMPYMVRFAY